MGQPFCITKWGKWCCKVAQVLKIGQCLLQSVAVIMKWGNYYKVEQNRRQMRETKDANRFWQLILRLTNLCDIQFFRSDSSKVELPLESKKARQYLNI